MLKLFLWLRYLRKRKIVLLSIAAVALSTALLIAVASLFTGFINVFEQTAVQTIGDVVLSAPIKFPKYTLFIEQLEQISAVKAATATLSSQGLLHLGMGNVRAVHIWGIEPARRARVTGFKQFLRKQGLSDKEPSFEVPGRTLTAEDAKHAEKESKLNSAVSANSEVKEPERVGGFLGIAVIAEPNEKTDEYDYSRIDQMIGQQVTLTTGTIIEAKAPTADNTINDTRPFSSAGGRFKRKTIQFTIADIVETGVYDLDKGFVYLPIEKLQETLYPNEDGPFASQIQIKLADNVQADVALAQIRGRWQAFAAEQLGWPSHLIEYTDIETAKRMQSQYVAELRKQMGILLLIFGVVSFSVVVLIFCIFYMITRLKQRDIAIVKSCGSASTSVAFVFLGFGGCVGIVGSGLGTVLGYMITKNINTIEEYIRIVFGLKLWKSSVYMFSEIPNNVNWGSPVDIIKLLVAACQGKLGIGNFDSAVEIIILSVAAAAIGALIPAIVAARTRPVEILRYE